MTLAVRQAVRGREGEANAERFLWLPAHSDPTPRLDRTLDGRNGHVFPLSQEVPHFQHAPEKRDWSFGNPLTYDHPLALAYGKRRFGQNEGFHGALERRFRLIKGKRWYRSRIEAETDTTIIFCVMHALAMEQRRRASATAASELQLAA